MSWSPCFDPRPFGLWDSALRMHFYFRAIPRLSWELKTRRRNLSISGERVCHKVGFQYISVAPAKRIIKIVCGILAREMVSAYRGCTSCGLICSRFEFRGPRNNSLIDAAGTRDSGVGRMCRINSSCYFGIIIIALWQAYSKCVYECRSRSQLLITFEFVVSEISLRSYLKSLLPALPLSILSFAFCQLASGLSWLPRPACGRRQK